MNKLTFLILLFSSAIAVSPMDMKSKAATSVASSCLGFYAVALSQKGKIERKDAIAEGELSLAKSTRNLAKKEAALTEDRQKLESEWKGLLSLQEEVERQKTLSLQQIQLTEEMFLAEASQKEQIALRRKNELDLEILKVRNRGARLLWRAKKKAWLFRKFAEEKGRVAAIAILDEAKNRAEKEAIALQEERARIDEEAQETQSELEGIMNETLEKMMGKLEESYEIKLEKAKEDFMAPFLADYKLLKEDKKALETRLHISKQEMANLRDIKLCKYRGDAANDRANDILIWMKSQHGIYADWVSSSIDPYGIFRLGFDLWVEDPKSLKKLSGLMGVLGNRLGLNEPPVVEFAAEPGYYMLTAMPKNTPAKEVSDLETLYKKAIAKDDLPASFASLDSVLRDRIADRAELEAEEAACVEFVPYAIKPMRESFSIDEIRSVKHWMFFRSIATKGKEHNVTTKNELLTLIYGVKKGYSTHERIDPVLNETLSQRLDRLMKVIGLQQQQAEEVDE